MCPAAQRCDLAHHACVDTDQLDACAGAADGTDCTAAAVPTGTCDQGVCLPWRCGDGYLQGAEQCDVGQPGALTCTDFEFYDDGDVACRADCTYETDKELSGCIGYCGDGEVRVGEELCDGDIAPPFACVELGYGAGHLDCSQCGPGLSDCKLFGWLETPMPSKLADVHGTAEDNIFAVSSEGPHVYYFNGLVWSTFDATTCGVGSTTKFSSVWTIGTNEAFATTLPENAVVHLTSTGCTRHTVSGTAFDVWAASATDVFVASSDGIQHYDGMTWTLTAGPFRTEIWGSGPTDVWASGSGDVVHFDGTAWSSPTVLPGVSVAAALWGTAANDVYAAGRAGGLDYVFHFDGTNWTPILDAYDGPGVESGTVAHGHPMIGFANAQIMTYDGALWTTVRRGSLPDQASNMWTAPSGKVYAANKSADVVLSFQGSTRIDLPSLTQTGTFQRVSIKSETEVYVVRPVSPYSGTLQRWDGLKWVQESTGSNPADVWIDSEGVVRVVEAAAQNGTGGGVQVRNPLTGAWSPVAGIPAGFRLWGASATDFWLLDGNAQGSAPRHFVDNAEVACTGCPSTSPLRDLWGATASNVFVVGATGAIYHYNGTAMTQMASGTTDTLWVVRGTPDGAHVWAGGENGTLLYLNGATWESLPFPDKGSTITSIWGASPSDLFVGMNRRMYHFDGEHWAPVASESGGMIGEIESVGDMLMYVDADSTGRLHQLVRIAPW